MQRLQLQALLLPLHLRQSMHLSSNNSTAIGHAAKASKKIYTLKVPTVQSKRKAVTAVPRRIFSNAHAYHINSVSVNSDGESYLSADDLRINMW